MLSLWHMDPLVNIKQRVAQTYFILLHSHHKRDGHFAALRYSLKSLIETQMNFPQHNECVASDTLRSYIKMII